MNCLREELRWSRIHLNTSKSRSGAYDGWEAEVQSKVHKQTAKWRFSRAYRLAGKERSKRWGADDPDPSAGKHRLGNRSSSGYLSDLWWQILSPAGANSRFATCQDRACWQRRNERVVRVKVVNGSPHGYNKASNDCCYVGKLIGY